MTCRGFTETNDRWFPKNGSRLLWKGGIPYIKHCQRPCPGSYRGHLTPWVIEFRKERRPPRPLYRAPCLGDVTCWAECLEPRKKAEATEREEQRC